MIHFGVHVVDESRFARSCRPWIDRLRDADSRLFVVSDVRSAAVARNRILEQATEEAGLEAVVLLRDDVSIMDRNFLPRIRRRLRDPTVGVLGAFGGQRLAGPDITLGRPLFGSAWSARARLELGPTRGQVDAVDGSLMVLSTAVAKRVRFDEERFAHAHACDLDYCYAVRQAGFTCEVEPFDVFIHAYKAAGSNEDRAANRAFVEKWRGELYSGTGRKLLALLDKAKGRVTSVKDANRVPLEELRQAAGFVASRIKRRILAFGAQTGQLERDIPSTRPGQDFDSATAVVGATCPLCEGELQEVVVADNRGRRVLRCEQCDLGVTVPTPSRDIASTHIWEFSYGGERIKQRARWLREAAHRVAWIEAYQPDGLLLEVGSATGEFVWTASRRGYEAVGVEPSVWAAEQAQQLGAEVFTGTLQEWQQEYVGFTVDVAALFHVLEHMSAPGALLAQLADVVRPGGWLFLEVPNWHARRASAGDPNWFGWDLDEHALHFSGRAIAELLAKHGFEPVAVVPTALKCYESRNVWLSRLNESRRAGFLESDRDLLRVAACRR